METLNQANPFFVRCIKSNTQKEPNNFDDMLVLVQLRYTGMLETVRIRQSGYSVRLTFEEFIQHYRILLPKGLLSSRNDILEFLEKMRLNRDNFQMGKTKVFLRESEKLCLDDILHQEILRRIITLQRWVRTWITQRKFHQMREAVLVLQKHVRRWLAQQRLIQLRWINNYEQWAAVTIQKAWKSFKDRSTFIKFRQATISFQAHVRGFLSRQRFSDRLSSFGRSKCGSTQIFVVTKSTPLIHTVQCLPPLPSSNQFVESSDGNRRKSNGTAVYESFVHSKLQDELRKRSDVAADLISKKAKVEPATSISTRSRVRSLAEIGTTQRHSTIGIRSSTTSTARSSQDSGLRRTSMVDKNSYSSALSVSSNTSSGWSSSVPAESGKSSLITAAVDSASFLALPTSSSNASASSVIQDVTNTISAQLPPPPLPPRKQSQVGLESSLSDSSDSKTIVSDTRDNVDVGSDDQESRLERRHNKLTHKLSLKRSKSSKFQALESDTDLVERVIRSPSENDIGSHHHTHPSTMDEANIEPGAMLQDSRSVSPSKSYDPTGSIIVSELTPSQQKNAFQKAKKHFKTLIIGGSSKSDRKSKENLTDCDSTSTTYDDDAITLAASSIESAASLSRRSKSNSCSVDLNSFAAVVGHQLVSCNEIIKSEQCSACEMLLFKVLPNSTNNSRVAVFKCVDCGLHFHAECCSNSIQIPCVSAKSVDFYTNASFSNFTEPARPPRLKQRQKQSSQELFNDQSSFASSSQASEASQGTSTTVTRSLDMPSKSFDRSSSNYKAFVAEPHSRQSTCSIQSELRQRSYERGKISHDMPVKSKSTSKLAKSAKSYQPYNASSSSSSWSVTRTAEFTDPRDILITDVTELHYMEIFIGNKLCEMESSKSAKKAAAKESTVDVVFKSALKEFKSNLISTYSVASAASDGRLHITYASLIEHFEQVMSNVCQKENTWKTFPVIMGVNAFRGYLDEFRNLSNKITTEEPRKEKPKSGVKRKRGKKKEPRDDCTERCGHRMHSVTANIPTVCEVCQSLMWLMEKVWVCRQCKLTCHKKCIIKISVSCRVTLPKPPGKRVFGAPLESLVADEQPIPLVLEKLITAIELRGLYTEGLYRKSGTTSKIAELKGRLDANEEPLDLDGYSVHVLSAALKSFFRDMPEPLMTFELYDDFLWATAVSDPQEKVQAIFGHISKLPRPNYDVLERLVFHLARVAQQEDANRMNPNSLAIVFAPCVLRTDKQLQMQDKLSDISKQTVVLECIINERLRQVRDTLADIDILDTACQTASSRLSSLRLSKVSVLYFHK